MNAIGPNPPPVSNTPLITNLPVNQSTADSDTTNDIFPAVEETSKSSASKASPNSNTPTNNENAAAEQQQQQELAVIRELASRDREVRAHEQAHAAVGGQYAGAASFTYQRGPDGVSYAVGGEVSISAPAGGGPQAALQAAEQIKRAALAPANPSAQDRQVAAQAGQAATQARAEIAALKTEGLAALSEEKLASVNKETTDKIQPDADNSVDQKKTVSADQAFTNVTNASDVGSVLNELA
jgi:hypothetical protein